MPRSSPRTAVRDVVAIGASAGGVEALTSLCAKLPLDFGAAILVALHIPPDVPSLLPRILSRAGAIRAQHAVEGERIAPGRIYCAPPNRHLLVRGGRVHLSVGARDNGHRPAVDPMFRSVAGHFGGRAVGVVLTGSGDDGTSGLAVIRARGGLAVAQAPESALFAQMPASAIAAGVVDHVVPLHDLAAFLTQLAGQRASRSEDLPPQVRMETRMTDIENPVAPSEPSPGAPSPLTCPDCGGVLQRIEDGVQPLHFRCQVGHGWGSNSLAAAQHEHIEFTLWAAVRSFVEQTRLMHDLADQAETRGSRSAVRYRERAAEAEAHASTLRAVLLGVSNEPDERDEPEG